MSLYKFRHKRTAKLYVIPAKDLHESKLLLLETYHIEQSEVHYVGKIERTKREGEK